MPKPQLADALRPDRWPVRPARAALAAVAVTATAVGGHVAGGGQASPAVVAGLTLGVFAVALGLTGRRLTTPQLVGLLLLGQAAVHLACMSPTGAPMSTLMVAGHVVATAVATVLMRRGEDLVFDLAARFRRMITRVRFERAVVPTPQRMPVWSEPQTSHRLLLAFVADGRGPPVAPA